MVHALLQCLKKVSSETNCANIGFLDTPLRAFMGACEAPDHLQGWFNFTQYFAKVVVL